MKKFINKCLVLLAMLTTGLANMSAQSATEGYFAGNSFLWKYSQETKTLTISGYGEMPNFNVSWNGDELNTDAPWREYWREIETVVVNEGVTKIGKYAFMGLPSLSRAELPQTLITIGTEAFAETALTSIVIPDGVTYVESAAFMYDEALTTIYVGRGIRRLGQHSGNESEGTGAFAYCKNVSDVYFYSAFNDSLSWYQKFEFAEDTDGLGTPAYSNKARFHVRDGYSESWHNKFPDVHGTFVGDLTGDIPETQSGQSETSLLPAAGEPTAYAIYCQSNQTLYFAYTDQFVQVGTLWDGQSVTSFWHGDQVTDIGWSRPGWYDTNACNATRVVFDESFSQVRPKSFFAWFTNFTKLTTIEGMEHLNTSEATVMNSMFLHCSSLTTVNVSYFDVGKVVNTSAMFSGCEQLTTISCSDAWDIDTSENMFANCYKLHGAVSFSASNTGASMANPDQGYFTRTLFPYVLFSDDDFNKLYFTFSTPIQKGDTWNGKRVDMVWTLNEGSNMPEWFTTFFGNSTLRNNLTTVVFDESFSRVRPKTCAYWFHMLTSLKRIQGIEYLNTSKVTNMRSMFEGCFALTELNLVGFDVRQVTDATSMFENCSKLNTIYCDHAWDIANTTNMFDGCTNLSGAVNYNPNQVNGNMARPIEGYFTSTGSARYNYVECAWNETTHQVEQNVRTTDAELLNSSKYRLTEGTYIIYNNVNYNNRIVVDGTVKLILGDGATMKAPRGIRINPNSTLNIYAQSLGSHMGTLIANGDGGDWAAIGGNRDASAGHLFIHGGNITAKATKNNAAGIGGGYGDGSGMKSITIYAGKIVAHGQKNAAGIGAGKNNNTRCTITIYGGNVTAEGGASGAGIGGALNRGNHITNIYGGTVSAKGGQYAAGIGGGEEGDGGTIGIYGGRIKAIAGEYPWYQTYISQAIGAGAKQRSGSLTISDKYNYLMVKKDGKIVGTTFRVNTCHSFGTVEILPCEHSLTYLQTDYFTKHKGDCAYCGYKTVPEEHAYQDGSCTVCGYNGDMYRVTVYKALTAEGTGYDGGITYLVCKDKNFEVPTIVRKDVPEGMVFMDWLQDPATAPATWEMKDGETLVESGSQISISHDTQLYARYRYEYVQAWQWADDLSSATLTVECGSDVVTLPVTVTTTTVSPADSPTGEGYVESVGVASYKRADGYTYSFTDTRTMPLYDDIVLNENEENTGLLAQYDQRYANVSYSRVLSAIDNGDGTWTPKAYTICLPYSFDFSAAVGDFDDVTVYRPYALNDGRELAFQPASLIVNAGQPSLVVINRGSVSLSAKGVQITKETEAWSVYEWKDYMMDEPVGEWKGTFSLIPHSDALGAYISQSDGKFKVVTDRCPSVKIPAFRSFFIPATTLPVNDLSVKYADVEEGGGEHEDQLVDFPASHFESDGDLSSDEPTAIIMRTDECDGTHRYFDLQGRPVDKLHTKGLYIEKGKKIIK